MTDTVSSPRVAALVGAFSSGKTSLLESLLFLTGAIGRKGTVNDGSRVGDASQEAKSRQMSVEMVIADTKYLDEEWTFIDTPGSVEFLQEAYHSMMIADIVVVVCDPDPARVVMVTPVLKFLAAHSIPHIIFVNKIENKKASITDIVEAIRMVSDKKLVVRQIPIEEGDEIKGYVDLTSERAYLFKDGEYEGNESKHLPKVPESFKDELEILRQDMMESVSDYDDKFMEELLEEQRPSISEIYEVMKKALIMGDVVPVFFGSGEQDAGVKRLLKALRHEAPSYERTKERLNITDKDGALCQVFKTIHAQHTGKLSVARIFNGSVAEGDLFAEVRPSGIYSLFGDKNNKKAKAEAGSVIALGRMDNLQTGDMATAKDKKHLDMWPEPLAPLFSLAITTTRKGEEVKLSGAINKIIDEDPSLSIEYNKDTGQMVLWGQGDVHLKVAIANLENRFNVGVEGTKPSVPYKETIKKSVKQQGRHKKQSGGAGQFGDVFVEIKPLSRGEGFQFINSVVGGSVPKNYIPAVETGCREYLKRGPFGFNVVDVSVDLYDGSSHPVDSSDQAFKMAGILAMKEGMPKCSPVLLEPVLTIEVSIPTECTSNAQRALSQRRGQILGFDKKEGWEGWDVLKANLPQSEMHDLIIDLRSITMGVGTFSWKFDRLQEISGKDADVVVENRKKELGLE
ncbi:MAG: elongation factor G [Alphaproteobacteria bacterium]